MFYPGKSYKVKVETSEGEVGFGRASIVEKDGQRMFVQLRTSKDANQVLPRGSKFWFVGEAAGNTFNGLWSTTVTGAKIVSGKTVMECRPPRFEPQLQRRSARRFPLDCAVDYVGAPGEKIDYQINAFNISRTGMALQTAESNPRQFVAGESATIVLHTEVGDIAIECRVIRTQFNWLANRCFIGVEFTDMNAESRERIDKLVEILKRRAPDEDQSNTHGSLSGWIRSTHENLRIVKPSGDVPK